MVNDTTGREASESETVGAKGIVTVRFFDALSVMNRFYRWENRSRRVKYQLLRRATPESVSVSENTPCVGHHEWVALSMDETESGPPPLRTVAVGRDSTTPQEGDRSLGDEVYRADIASYERDGQTFTAATVLDTQEANVDVDSGESLTEMGVYGGDDDLNEITYLINHALFATPIDKDSSTIATITCEFSWSPA